MTVAGTTFSPILAWDNRADLATLTASSQDGELVAANVQDYRAGKVWQTTGCASETLALDQGAVARASVGAVFLENHNLGAAGFWRYEVSDLVDFSTHVYDSGLLKPWPSLVGAGQGQAGEGGAGGYPLLTALNDYRYRAWHILPTPVKARYRRLTLIDPTNPAGKLRVGRFFDGPKFQPERGVDLPYKMGWVDPGGSVRTKGSTLRLNKKRKWRRLTLNFSSIVRAEAIVEWADFGRIVGQSREFFLVLLPQAQFREQYESTIYCVATTNGDLSRDSTPWYSKPVVCEEIN